MVESEEDLVVCGEEEQRQIKRDGRQMDGLWI